MSLASLAATPCEENGRLLALSAFVKGQGRPLPRAEIRVSERVVYTDAVGQAALCLGAGDVEAVVTRSGFVPQTVLLPTAPTSELQIYLEPDDDLSTEPQTIDVIGRRRKTDTRVGVSADEATLVSPLGGDPAQVIRTLPGTQTYGFRPEVVMRGSPPGDSRYYIDDLEVPFAFHRIGLVSVLHDRAIDDVELEVGGFGAQYGESTGGIVVLRSRQEPPTRPLTDIRVNIPAGASLYHERPTGEDGGVRVALRRSYLDAFLPQLAKKEAGLTLSPYSGDFYASYSARRDDGGDTVTLLGSYDGLVLAFPDQAGEQIGESIDFDVFNAFGLLGWERRMQTSGGWTARITPQAAFVRNESRLLANRVDFDRQLLRIPVELSRPLDKEGRRLRLGVDARHLVHRLDYQVVDTSSGSAQASVLELPSYGLVHATIPETTLAAWASTDVALGHTTITPGARLTHASPLDATTLDPRVAVSIPLEGPGAQVVTASAGRYTKSPAPEVSSEIFGNPDLGYERAAQYAVGWSGLWSSAWVTSLSLYAKDGDKLPVSNGSTYTDSGELRSHGLEVFLRRMPGARVFGWIAYTYSKTETRSDKGVVWSPSTYDQTHVLSLTLGGRIARTWQAGARFARHTGDPFDRVSVPVYDPVTDRYTALVRPDDRNGRRLPDFHQADLALLKDIPYDTWTLRLKFGVEFLSRKPQAVAARYNADYTDVNYFVGPPPVPYVEVRGVL